MATLTTKFNVGDRVYVLKSEAELQEASCEIPEFFESVRSGIAELKITKIIFDNDGIKYGTTDYWDDSKIYYEFQLFESEKDAFFKAIIALKNHLEENLNRTIKLIKEIEADYEGCREKYFLE